MQFRSNRFAAPEVVRNIIILNVLFLLATWGFDNIGVNLKQYLGLFLPESRFFKFWQPITHMFMHANITHLLFNMFAVWIFGSKLEQVWGPRRFLTFYFIAGIGAMLMQVGVHYIEFYQIFPKLSAEQFLAVLNVDAKFINHGGVFIDQNMNDLHRLMNVTMVGASGAVFGLLAAFAMYFPNTQLYLLFIPFPIKAKYFVLGYAFFELFNGVANFGGSNIAHFAHLGGAIFGFIVVKWWNRNNRTTLY